MKRVTLMVALGLSCMVVTTAAWAQNYGAAGCGLGSLIFQSDNSQGMQILASTTNGTFGNQTFGITSGTSNCTSEGLIKESRARQAFVEVNFESLNQEMAKGQGEHLTAFAHLMGCSETHVRTFGRVVQRNYTQIFSSYTTTPLEVIGAVQQSLAADPVLAQACQV